MVAHDTGFIAGGSDVHDAADHSRWRDHPGDHSVRVDRLEPVTF
jgi:hypothetical protein